MFQMLKSVSVALGFILLVSCSSAINQQQGRTGDRTYTNEEIGFAIDIPSEWAVEENMMGVVMVALAPIERGANYRHNFNITYENLPGNFSLNQYFQAGQRHLRREFPDYELNSRRMVQYQREMMRADANYTVEGIRVRSLQFATLAGNRAYVITFATLPEHFHEVEPLFERAISTFRLL